MSPTGCAEIPQQGGEPEWEQHTSAWRGDDGELVQHLVLIRDLRQTAEHLGSRAVHADWHAGPSLQRLEDALTNGRVPDRGRNAGEADEWSVRRCHGDGFVQRTGPDVTT
jgi:hypothetical protein